MDSASAAPAPGRAEYADLLQDFPTLSVKRGKLRCECGKAFSNRRKMTAKKIRNHLRSDRHTEWADEDDSGAPSSGSSSDASATAQASAAAQAEREISAAAALDAPPPNSWGSPPQAPYMYTSMLSNPHAQPRAPRGVTPVRPAPTRTRWRFHWKIEDGSEWLGVILLLLTVAVLGFFATMVASWVMYSKPSTDVPAINAAVAAYDSSTSILSGTAGWVEATTALNKLVGESTLQSRTVTRTITGWTKGLTTKTIGGIAMRTTNDVPFVGDNVSLDVSVEQRGGLGNLTVSVPVPDSWRRFVSTASGSNCLSKCADLGSNEAGGSSSKSCSTDEDGTESCSCTCYYRRYLTTACYVVVDKASTLSLRPERPTCSPPYSLARGHEYLARSATSAVAVELRTSDDPLLVALAVTDGTLKLERRKRWLMLGIIFSILTGVFGVCAGALWFITGREFLPSLSREHV